MSAAPTRTGIPFVVAAPSGTGKTTVCRWLVDQDPDCVFSVSHTTRKPRASERDGVDYHFVAGDEFQTLAAAGAFLEWASYNGHCYGTHRTALDEALATGHDVLLEIEIQGAAQVRERRADARLVFLVPPSLETLEQRLRARASDSEQAIASRLDTARRELEAIDRFDYAVENADLARCVADVAAIIAAERRGDASELRRRFDPARARARLLGG